MKKSCTNFPIDRGELFYFIIGGHDQLRCGDSVWWAITGYMWASGGKLQRSTH